MKTIDLVIIGAGGHARVVAESANKRADFNVVGFLDDSVKAGEIINGYPVLGDIALAFEESMNRFGFVVAIGNNNSRAELQEKLSRKGKLICNIIDLQAIISSGARLSGKGIVILPGAVVQDNAEIQDGVIVNCNCVVDHDSFLGSFSHLGVGVSLPGGSRISSFEHIKAQNYQL